MRRSILILVVLFILAAGLSAVSVTIGTGTTSNTSTTSPSPYGNYFKNERDQYLFTASEINTAGGGFGNITTIAFNVEALNGCEARPLWIKMGDTALAAFPNAAFLTGTTQVFYNAAYQPVAGVNTHTLDTPFYWNGTSNLLVEVIFGTIATNSSYSASVYYTSTSSIWKTVCSRDNVNDVTTNEWGYPSPNRANITFDMESYGPAAPGPASIVSPLNGAINVLRTASMNWTPGFGMPTGYRLQYGTNTDGDNLMPLTDILNVNTFDPAGLFQYGQTYYWKVIPYNAIDDATNCPVWSFTIEPDTTEPLPYTQDFNSGITNEAINWSGIMYISPNHGNNGTNGLCRNLYGYTPTANAVTCPIGPMADYGHLTFEYRIVDSVWYPTYPTPLGANDKIEVWISTDDGITFPELLYTINQINHVTSMGFATVTIPLRANYENEIIRVKFLCTWGEGDYYVDIDNFSVIAVPAPTGPVMAPNLVYPIDRKDNLPITGFPFRFSWNTGGTEPDVYSLYIANVVDLTLPYNSDQFFDVATAFEDVTSPYSPAFIYDYEGTYVWTVGGYNAAYPNEVFLWPPYEFTIDSNPLINVPWLENFDALANPNMPNHWTIIGSHAGSDNRQWQSTSDRPANSEPNATVVFYHEYYPKNEWMISPPVAMQGGQQYAISFALQAPGWEGMPEALALRYATEPTIAAMNANAPLYDNDNIRQATWTTIQLPFMPATTGNYYFGWHAYSEPYIDYILVDDIAIYFPASVDAEVASIDIKGVYPAEAFTPRATVVNNGIQAVDFSVTMNIGDAYTSVQAVTGLAPGTSQQVSFAQITPELYEGYNVTVAVTLAGDEVQSNDEMSSAFYCLPIDKQAYGDDTYLGVGPVTFNLKNPGTLTDLPAPDPLTQFLAGADWLNAGWCGVEHNTTNAPFWQMNPTTGAGTQIGLTGYPELTGVAYDSNHHILYGCTTSSLYTITPATGAATFVATLNTDWEVFLLSIAYDTWQDKLYAHDGNYDALFEIDLNTNTIAPATGYGYGYNFNYQQDLAFDRETGLLYLAGTVSLSGSNPPAGGALFWIHPADASAWKIDDFQNKAVVAGFAIPYFEDHLAIAIALDGTISWSPVAGASYGYNIYASDNPYSGFAYAGNTLNSSWIDPNFPQAKKFYYVTVSGSATRHVQRIQSNDTLKRGEPIIRGKVKPGIPASWISPLTK